METNQDFTDVIRLLADSLEHPDPDRSPLSDNAMWHTSGVPDHLLEIGSKAAHDQEWWLRHKAATCLGEVGPATIPDLRRLSQHEHPIVQRAGSESLRKIEAAI